MISFFSLYELFPAIICANDTGSLVNSLFGVKILIPFPSTFLLPSKGGMGDTSLSLPNKSIKTLSFYL